MEQRNLNYQKELDFYGHQDYQDSIEFEELGEVEENSNRLGKTEEIQYQEQDDEMDEFISSSSHQESESFDQDPGEINQMKNQFDEILAGFMEKKQDMIRQEQYQEPEQQNEYIPYEQTDRIEMTETNLFHYTKSNQKRQSGLQSEEKRQVVTQNQAQEDDQSDEDLAFSPLKANMNIEQAPQTDRNELDQIEVFREQNAIKNVQMGNLQKVIQDLYQVNQEDQEEPMNIMIAGRGQTIGELPPQPIVPKPQRQRPQTAQRPLEKSKSTKVMMERKPAVPVQKRPPTRDISAHKSQIVSSRVPSTAYIPTRPKSSVRPRPQTAKVKPILKKEKEGGSLLNQITSQMVQNIEQHNDNRAIQVLQNLRMTSVQEFKINQVPQVPQVTKPKKPVKIQNQYSGIASLKQPKPMKKRRNDPVSLYQNMQSQWQKQKLKQKQKQTMKNVEVPKREQPPPEEQLTSRPQSSYKRKTTKTEIKKQASVGNLQKAIKSKENIQNNFDQYEDFCANIEIEPEQHYQQEEEEAYEPVNSYRRGDIEPPKNYSSQQELHFNYHKDNEQYSLDQEFAQKKLKQLQDQIKKIKSQKQQQ